MLAARFFVWLGLLIGAHTVIGQYPYGAYGGYGPPAGYGYGHGFARGGSTVLGSQLHGMADLVRSSGYANLRNSEAAINAEEARSRQLDNRVKYAQTYYERKRIREEAKAYDNNKITMEQVHRMAALKRPRRLGSEQLNPVTGEISWPLAAMQPMMNGTRRRISQLFAERTDDGKLQPQAYFEIVRLCDLLDEQLGKELGSIPMQAVSQAKAFVKSLAYEARLAAT